MDTINKQPFSQRAKVFLQDLLALRKVFDETLVDVLAGFAPWLAPVAPAYLTGRNMIAVLGFPRPVAVTVAVVVECLGVALITTGLQFWRHNRQYPGIYHGKDRRLPTGLVVLLFAWQTAVVLLAVGGLDAPQSLVDGRGREVMQLAAKVLLATLSIPGAGTLALRAFQAGVVAEIRSDLAEEERLERERKAEERRAERERKERERLEREAQKAARDLPESSAPSGEAPVWAHSRAAIEPAAGNAPEGDRKAADWRDLTVEDKLLLSGKTPKEIAALYPITGRTARTWHCRLEKNGFHQG